MGVGHITIGVAREGLSPENPSESGETTDHRVAINPSDVERFLGASFKFPVNVLVEEGAGAGIGYSSQSFERAGARIVSAANLYCQSDVLLKLKGPSNDNIRRMKPGALLGCFAHLETFPARAQAARDANVNVLALEEILESPKYIPPSTAFARGVALSELQKVIEAHTDSAAHEVKVICFGFSPELFAFAQQSSRMGCAVSFLNDRSRGPIIAPHAGPTVFVYDSASSQPRDQLFESLVTSEETLLNLNDFEEQRDSLSLQYLKTQQTAPFGKRRVECLTETGMCGARYGLELLEKISPLSIPPQQANVVVLGYGHVARGAIQECLRQGVPQVCIVGRGQLSDQRITPYLENANLIINGIDLGDEKGKTFVVTKKHVTEHTVKPGSVIIDLVGGSKQEPSAVELIRECTFLERPYFTRHNVLFSALWGWPMMYMMRESSDAYSAQITDLFMQAPELLDQSFERADFGIQRALFLPSSEKETVEMGS